MPELSRSGRSSRNGTEASVGLSRAGGNPGVVGRASSAGSGSRDSAAVGAFGTASGAGGSKRGSVGDFVAGGGAEEMVALDVGGVLEGPVFPRRPRQPWNHSRPLRNRLGKKSRRALER